MKTRSIALALAAVLLASAAAAAPTAGPAVTPTLKERELPKIKTPTKLEVKNAAAVPGEKRTLVATLTSGTNPLAGKSVSFRVEGKDGTTVPGGAIDVGSDVTDAQGTAKVTFNVPELAQGAYKLVASHAGDAQTMGSTDTGNFGVIKGITKIELGDLIWGTYKNEPGPKTGSVIVKLVRQSDGATLAKPVVMTVNGQTWTVGGPNSTVIMIPLPTNASTWNVKAQFEGDAANQASSSQRTYTKPNS